MKPIPYTALTSRYVKLKDRPSAERLREAENVSASELAEEFAASAEAFEAFRTHQAFFDQDPDTRDADKDPRSDARTYGWAMAMKRQDSIGVNGDRELDFAYVEREIIPTRTRPQAGFDREEGKHVRVDLVLANAKSRRPIVAELKIAHDKDAYTALVQALAGASQLVSTSQRERLAKLRIPVASMEDEPQIDVYVLLAQFPTRGRDRFKQLERAASLAGGLQELGLIRLGRVRILGLSGPREAIQATTELPLARP